MTLSLITRLIRHHDAEAATFHRHAEGAGFEGAGTYLDRAHLHESFRDELTAAAEAIVAVSESLKRSRIPLLSSKP